MTQVTQEAAPLVRQLADALKDANVLYCHWKSNAFVDRAERAETDLDLLVAGNQVRVFTEVVSRCGFVAADRPDATRPPAVAHFFAYDSVVDRFVHVHAHYRLVLGHDRTKNYRLPVEGPFLASVSTAGILPTPSPEFEYVVFVIRMVLKYALWDEAVWSLSRGRRPKPRPSEAMEFAQLRDAVSPEMVTAVLDEHLPFIGGRMFNAAERALLGETGLCRAVMIGHAMEARLHAHARRTPAVDGLVRSWRRVAVSARRRMRRSSGYRLTSGGAVIAIMGGDGAGKSTAVAEICTWLDSYFDVAHIHLGKPRWSWTTYVVRGGLKMLQRAGVLSFSRPDERPDAPMTSPRLAKGRLLWYACKARDRYLTYRKASRVANNGGLVVSDRYPHSALQMTDIPQIERLTRSDKSTPVLRGLVRLEKRYHDLIALPELAVVLKLEPREAARRKTEEPYEYVVERASEIWNIDWETAGVHVIDASQPLHAVIAQLKAVIWESLS